jgi:radical SAM superfamily enzyme YgiQ (UPF0313 family)
MSSTILLIRPNHTQDKKDNYLTFPLGLAYVGGFLIKEGYEVKIIDLALEDVNYDNTTKKIKEINPYIIGISALSFQYSHIKKLVSYLKNIVSCKIVLGGFLSSYNYNLILEKTKVDICIVGEGELVLLDIIKNLNNLSNINGIVYKDNQKIIENPSRELITNLDDMPFPAYELFDIEKYLNFSMTDISIPHTYLKKKKKHRQITILGGRGCPFSCNFCSKMNIHYRLRSIDNIMREIKYLRDKYDIDIFGFYDELLFLNKDRLKEFCEKIKELDINWYGDIRVNLVNYETLKLFKESGCLTISFGVESGSNKILKNMNKKITSKEIEETIKNCLKLNLIPGMGLILGYPGENVESIKETINLFKRVGYPAFKFRYITPYPGSKLYNECIENKIIEDEEKYLESIGDGTGPYRFRFNFTEFTDNQLYFLLPYVVKKILNNYLFYLLKHPFLFFKRLLQKNFMNPIYYYYYSWCHPTNYDKAAKSKEGIKEMDKLFK